MKKLIGVIVTAVANFTLLPPCTITNFRSFVRDSHFGCVLYNGKDNCLQINR